MASTAQKRQWWSDWRCDTSKMVGVEFPGWSTPLLVADAAAPAFRLFADLMRAHGYFFRESAGGTYNCRRINHDPNNNWSLHAYGLALDLNPSANPPGDPDHLSDPQHDYPQGFIDDVLATGLFRWGWDWDEDGSSDDHSFIDPMHWEIDVPPDQIRNNIGDTMFVAADGRSGWAKSGPVVEYWQHFLRKLDPSYDPGVGGWGDATSSEFAAELAKFSPGPAVIGPGEKLALESLLIQHEAPEPDGGLSRSQVRAIVNDSQIVAPD